MGHKHGESREQVTLFPIMLDELVAEDALVRVIDAWIESLNMQALVIVNRGDSEIGSGAKGATGGEVMTLAKAIQTSVYERFGIRLEPEPVVV